MRTLEFDVLPFRNSHEFSFQTLLCLIHYRNGVVLQHLWIPLDVNSNNVMVVLLGHGACQGRLHHKAN